MKIILYIILIFNISELFAGEVKFRAREHYEVITIKDNDNSEKYKGFSNTVNIWWEKPYDISFGLSFSPIFSSLKGEEDSIYGEKVKIINAGLELKYFYKQLLKYMYFRPGLSYTILKPDTSLKNRTGMSGYLGIGYEYPFKKFGLAFELAYRYSDLEHDTRIEAFTPSVGLHFYKSL